MLNILLILKHKTSKLKAYNKEILLKKRPISSDKPKI